MATPTLLIMAAGSSSRYAGTVGRLKQTTEVGPGGEWLLEYTICDAMRLGFGKVVLVIRKSTEEIFRMKCKKISTHISVDFAYQEIPAHRSKPWGTVDAALSARSKVLEPFLILNADDYYGRSTLKTLYHFLVDECSEKLYAMPGFEVRNTLSDSGAVTRAECHLNESGFLAGIEERAKISRKGEIIVCEDAGVFHELNPTAIVSMNCWALHPSFMGHAQKYFDTFRNENRESQTAECFLPSCIQHLISDGSAVVKVLPTDAEWFGMTYASDHEKVSQQIASLVNRGFYPSPLWK